MTAFALALALAAPVPKGEEKLPPPTAEQYRTASNNLKQIGLAVHNYHDVYGKLPANVVDAKGKALLSWRVLVLPFIEEDQLFKDVKMDEPWDSDANKKLLARMPKVFAPVRAKAKPGETYLCGFDGPGAIFESGKKLGIFSVTDGLSNTAMVVEAATAVEWTKPADVAFDPANVKALKLGAQFDGEAYVLRGDGSVFRMRKDVDEESLKRLVQKDDGNVIDGESLIAKPAKKEQ